MELMGTVITPLFVLATTELMKITVHRGRSLI